MVCNNDVLCIPALLQYVRTLISIILVSFFKMEAELRTWGPRSVKSTDSRGKQTNKLIEPLVLKRSNKTDWMIKPSCHMIQFGTDERKREVLTPFYIVWIYGAFILFYCLFGFNCRRNSSVQSNIKPRKEATNSLRFFLFVFVFF